MGAVAGLPANSRWHRSKAAGIENSSLNESGNDTHLQGRAVCSDIGPQLPWGHQDLTVANHDNIDGDSLDLGVQHGFGPGHRANVVYLSPYHDPRSRSVYAESLRARPEVLPPPSRTSPLSHLNRQFTGSASPSGRGARDAVYLSPRHHALDRANRAVAAALAGGDSAAATAAAEASAAAARALAATAAAGVTSAVAASAFWPVPESQVTFDASGRGGAAVSRPLVASLERGLRTPRALAATTRPGEVGSAVRAAAASGAADARAAAEEQGRVVWQHWWEQQERELDRRNVQEECQLESASFSRSDAEAGASQNASEHSGGETVYTAPVAANGIESTDVDEPYLFSSRIYPESSTPQLTEQLKPSLQQHELRSNQALFKTPNRFFSTHTGATVTNYAFTPAPAPVPIPASAFKPERPNAFVSSLHAHTMNRYVSPHHATDGQDAFSVRVASPITAVPAVPVAFASGSSAFAPRGTAGATARSARRAYDGTHQSGDVTNDTRHRSHGGIAFAAPRPELSPLPAPTVAPAASIGNATVTDPLAESCAETYADTGAGEGDGWTPLRPRALQLASPSPAHAYTHTHAQAQARSSTPCYVNIAVPSKMLQSPYAHNSGNRNSSYVNRTAPQTVENKYEDPFTQTHVRSPQNTAATTTFVALASPSERPSARTLDTVRSTSTSINSNSDAAGVAVGKRTGGHRFFQTPPSVAVGMTPHAQSVAGLAAAAAAATVREEPPSSLSRGIVHYG